MVASAFTCTGPYAILILLGIKRVENRSAMPVPAKGRCAISCSKSFCREEYGEVFGAALKADAKAVIVAHNHPSGDMTPSVQDRELTIALKRLGEALGVTVLDHLIITGKNHEYEII